MTMTPTIQIQLEQVRPVSDGSTVRTAADASRGFDLRKIAELTPAAAAAKREVNDKGLLSLVEIYNSVKGEGTQAGIPMTFVRFSGCNLACDFCDTPYNRVAIRMTEDQLVDYIRKQETAWVIFTGGEPTLQLKKSLTERLKSMGVRMAIETNGMIWTDAFLDLDYINISPKTAFTTPNDSIPVEKRIAPKLVAAVAEGKVRINEVRYIIGGPKDDIFELPVSADFITISPMMHDCEPNANFESGKGHSSMYGIVNQSSLNRCMELVWRYRHLNARLSVQVHKFVGVR